MGMKVLITGASGLLGANLTLAAMDRGHTVTALYHSHPLSAHGLRARCISLLHVGSPYNIVWEETPDVLFHCAALTNVDHCEGHPQQALEHNAQITWTLASNMRAYGKGKFIHISTDQVFNGQKEGLYQESDAPCPINIYSATKLMAEAAARYAPNHLIVRTDFYGWNMQDKFSLAEWVLDRLQQGLTVPGFVDVSFTPIYVGTLVEKLLDLAEMEAHGLLHLGGSEACSKYLFACWLAEEFEIGRAHV